MLRFRYTDAPDQRKRVSVIFTHCYDRRHDDISLDEVERIRE